MASKHEFPLFQLRGINFTILTHQLGHFLMNSQYTIYLPAKKKKKIPTLNFPSYFIETIWENKMSTDINFKIKIVSAFLIAKVFYLKLSEYSFTNYKCN